MIAQIYSVERDRYGDPVETLKGDIEVIPGGVSVEPWLDSVSVTSGQVGIKRGSSTYEPKTGDKLRLPDGMKYALVGPAKWNYASFTGWQPAYFWWDWQQSN